MEGHIQRVWSLIVRVRMLHYYLRVGSRITITHSCTHTMQHTHKAVTGRVEAKSYSLVEGNRTIVTLNLLPTNFSCGYPLFLFDTKISAEN